MSFCHAEVIAVTTIGRIVIILFSEICWVFKNSVHMEKAAAEYRMRLTDLTDFLRTLSEVCTVKDTEASITAEILQWGLSR